MENGSSFSKTPAETNCGISSPFPLTAAKVATDRLPDKKPLPNGQVLSFIVAFQPADVVTNLPVAVDYPNTTGTPAGTQSFVLIMDDPDAPDPAAPKRTYVHWVLYDIPSAVSTLAEGVKSADLREGMRDGSNDWKRTGYGGPCPPIGRHRYFFKLYALDRKLGNLGAATKADVQQLMANHVIETAELVGTYERTKK